MSDDARLVAALLAGEDGAWDRLVSEYAGFVQACARKVLAGRGGRTDPADVDDVAENVFVMLLEKDGALLRRYDPRHRLAAYLAVIARTAAHRLLRRRKPGVDLPDEMWGEAIAERGVQTISEEATHREVRDAVRASLDDLTERERRVLRLCYYEGLDYQQIAETLGVSPNSVGAALSRARAKLAQVLRERPDLTESDFRSI